MGLFFSGMVVGAVVATLGFYGVVMCISYLEDHIDDARSEQ